MEAMYVRPEQGSEPLSCELAVVLPTLNEKDNLSSLLWRLHRALLWESLTWKAVIVDDGSSDGTQQEALRLSRRYPLSLLARKGRRGLSSAILDGIRSAPCDLVVVMDADGSHPPEAIPRLLQPLLEGKADVVVGSRYMRGASLQGLSRGRRWASRLATSLARSLTSIHDPLSGFFALRRDRILWEDLQPKGFKLLWELLVRNPHLRVREVPTDFLPRRYGKSKMRPGVVSAFILQWAALSLHEIFRSHRQFLRFCVVGLVGFGVDVLAFQALLHGFSLPPLQAQGLSFWIAATHNFLWNRKVTFPNSDRLPAHIGYIRFLLLGLVSLSFRTALISYLMNMAGLGVSWALLFGILASVLMNFAGSKWWALGRPPRDVPFLVPLRETMVWGCIAVLLLWRLFYAGLLQLLPEEAYYWNYAVHLSLSYFDHPPMVAWIIWIGTRVLGNTEIGVRIGFLLLGLGTSWLLYRLGELWFSKQVGLASALASQILPLTFGEGMLAFPDGPLFFFELLTAYGVTKALLEHKGSWWFFSGAALGLALLSKYTALLLVPSCLLILLGRPEWRRWLLRPEPYMGLLIALVFFSPVLLWNAHHNWASFRFQFAYRLARHDYNPLTNFVRFWVSQMAIQTPFLFLAMMMGLLFSIRNRRSSGPGWILASGFSLPCIGAFALYGLQSWVKINWPAPAFLFLLLPAMALYVGHPQDGYRFTLPSWLGSGIRATPYFLLFMAAVALYHLTVGIPGVPAPTRAIGWRELSASAIQMQRSLREIRGRSPFFLGMDKYSLASELAFYTHQPQRTFSQDVVGADGLGYAYWTDPSSLSGQDAVAVVQARKRDKIRLLLKRFRKVGPLQPVEISWGGRTLGSFLLVPAMGYLTEPHRENSKHHKRRADRRGRNR